MRTTRSPTRAAAGGALLASLLGLYVASSAAETESPTATEADLPRVGRSLFDEIVRVPDGERARLEVPYQFPKLVAWLDASVARPAAQEAVRLRAAS